MAETLVLGADGFIGSHLVDSLADRGHTVRAFDRFSKARPSFNAHQNVEIFAGDFLNAGQLAEAVDGVDYVFHFISTTTPATAENDPTIDIDTNIRMSVELMKLASKAQVKRLLFASTGGAIYGAENTHGAHVETDPVLPVSPYAIGKLAIENYLRYFRVKHGLESTAYRISNPYGERQPFHRKQGVIPIFLENMHLDKPITVLGDGSMVRDYIYAKDLTDMISDTFDKDELQDVYNMGSGAGTSVAELVDLAQEVSGKEATVERKAVPPTFLQSVILDTNRFTTDFGLSAHTSLRDGMRATYTYIQNEIERAGIR